MPRKAVAHKTSWTSLASTCSSQHYYAVVSKDHVYCIKIDSYIGSSTIIITTHRDVEIVQRPFSRIRLPTWGFCFGLHFDSCFFSPFRGKFTLLRLKTLRSHQSRFLRLTIVKYDSSDNIKMIFKLQVRSSLGVSVYCSGRTWSLILILMLLGHPLIYRTSAERFRWQPSVFPWRNLARMVSSLDSEMQKFDGPCHEISLNKNGSTTRCIMMLVPGVYTRFLFTSSLHCSSLVVFIHHVLVDSGISYEPCCYDHC